MTKLVIIGAGGHGAVAADAALLMNKWQEVVFLDDKDFGGNKVLGLPVVGRGADWAGMIAEATEFFVAIGSNTRRQEIMADIDGGQGAIATIVHPSATVSPFASVAPGALVCAGALINPRAVIGAGAIVNTGATVDHDCVLGDSVHISPGANIGGEVSVGARTWVGIGAAVKQCVRIAEDVVVGAGAVVVSDVAASVTVIGVPAKPIL